MPKKPAPPPRRRRAPEEAREEILVAAERVIAKDGPDRAGLKSVATEAGVSHALVTHYFGTYDALVREVFDRNNRSLAGAVLQALASADGPLRPRDLVERFADVLRAPQRVKLLAYAFLQRDRVLPAGSRGDTPLPALVDALVETTADLARAQGKAPPARDDVAMALLVGLCAIQWYGLSTPSVLEAMGLPEGEATDARFKEALGFMVDAFVLR